MSGSRYDPYAVWWPSRLSPEPECVNCCRTCLSASELILPLLKILLMHCVWLKMGLSVVKTWPLCHLMAPYARSVSKYPQHLTRIYYCLGIHCHILKNVQQLSWSLHDSECDFLEISLIPDLWCWTRDSLALTKKWTTGQLYVAIAV